MGNRAFLVVKPGLQTTVQDCGRTGYQKDGISPAGALDRYALQVANLLLRNPRCAAAVEMALLGPELLVLMDTEIAVCGAPFRAMLDGVPLAIWRSTVVRAGQTLRFGSPIAGVGAVMAVAGGIDVPLALGSRSTLLRASLGGLEGRALRERDALLAPETDRSLLGLGRALARELVPHFTAEAVVRVVRGPEFDQFSPHAQAAFFAEQYTVSTHSDRMGCRLQGPSLERHSQNVDLLSEGVPLGAVQVPPDGLPIILLADRQTTGGYPRIATVASVDVSVVAQMPPGGRLTFVEVSVDEAQDLAISQERQLRTIAWVVG